LMEMRAARTENAGLGDLDTLKHLDARGEE